MLNERVLIVVGVTLGVLAVVALRAQPRAAKEPSLTALDYAEIQQLNSHYAQALDTCADKGNEFADLFAPDGYYVQADGKKVGGRTNLAAMAGGPTCAPPKGPLYLHHIFVNAMIELSPEGAIGKSYFLGVNLGENGKAGQIERGAKVYDVYTKTAAGWRYKSRAFVQDVERIPVSELSKHPQSR